jgi:hypothetical protein
MYVRTAGESRHPAFAATVTSHRFPFSGLPPLTASGAAGPSRPVTLRGVYATCLRPVPCPGRSAARPCPDARRRPGRGVPGSVSVLAGGRAADLGAGAGERFGRGGGAARRGPLAGRRGGVDAGAGAGGAAAAEPRGLRTSRPPVPGGALAARGRLTLDRRPLLCPFAGGVPPGLRLGDRPAGAAGVGRGGRSPELDAGADPGRRARRLPRGVGPPRRPGRPAGRGPRRVPDPRRIPGGGARHPARRRLLPAGRAAGRLLFLVAPREQRDVPARRGGPGPGRSRVGRGAGRSRGPSPRPAGGSARRSRAVARRGRAARGGARGPVGAAAAAARGVRRGGRPASDPAGAGGEPARLARRAVVGDGDGDPGGIHPRAGRARTAARPPGARPRDRPRGPRGLSGCDRRRALPRPRAGDRSPGLRARRHGERRAAAAVDPGRAQEPLRPVLPRLPGRSLAADRGGQGAVPGPRRGAGDPERRTRRGLADRPAAVARFRDPHHLGRPAARRPGLLRDRGLAPGGLRRDAAAAVGRAHPGRAGAGAARASPPVGPPVGRRSRPDRGARPHWL